MTVQNNLHRIREKFNDDLIRTDIPADNRLILWVKPEAVKNVAKFIFRDLDARYCVSIGMDDREHSGGFLVAHDFALDKENLIISVIVPVDGKEPEIQSISEEVPAANWSEREMQDLLGIKQIGCPNSKRFVLPDGWPENMHPLRKDIAWNHVPKDFDDNKIYPFETPPEGCSVIPFWPVSSDFR